MPGIPSLKATVDTVCIVVTVLAVAIGLSQQDGVVKAVQEAFTSKSANDTQEVVASALEQVGVKVFPNPVQLAFLLSGFLMATVISLSLYCWLSRPKRLRIEERLRDAKERVSELEEQLEDQKISEFKAQGKEIRIFMEGAFDLMHFGHMNAFRLGKSLGSHLVVGINSSESIAECKGFAPVMTDSERTIAVAGCSFVDEVIEKTPYVMTEEYLAWVVEKYKIDYVVHGDDPCLVNGEDVYKLVKQQGKFKSIPRTEGVSTTDIVGRMLLCTREHHVRAPELDEDGRPRSPTLLSADLFARSSRFLTTSSVLRQFSKNVKPPQPGDKVVYMDGSWDMFHAGHIEALEAARSLGDYLIVGIFNDDVVNQYRGENFPIMNLNERTLSVLGCKHANDVLIDCPWIVGHDMLKSLKVDVVVSGTVADVSVDKAARFAEPIRQGIYREIDSPHPITVGEILERINANRARYEKKFISKKKNEDTYYANRYDRKAEATD